MKAILTFHSLDQSGDVIAYDPFLFRELISTVLEKNIIICSLDDIVKPATDNAIAITFDDGINSLHENLLPVLHDFKIPASLYLTAGYVAKQNNWPTMPDHAKRYSMLDWQQIEELQVAGLSIESHTLSHPDMRVLSKQEIMDECGEADKIIESKTGKKPKHFAYPYGYFNDTAVAVVRTLYESAVTTRLGYLNSNAIDCSLLPRLDTYYLQDLTKIRKLNSLQMRMFIRVRALLRKIRGSEC